MVKVWCVPLNKVPTKGTEFQWRCKKAELALRANRFLMAQQKVVEECGLLDVTVKVCVIGRVAILGQLCTCVLSPFSQVWIAPVNAVEPSTGLHIWWYGLWMQRAPGISLNQLSYVTMRAFVQETVMGLLQV